MAALFTTPDALRLRAERNRIAAGNAERVKGGTVARVNAALKELGHAERLRQGRGYCYFYGGDAEAWFTSSVAVCYAVDLSVLRWLEERDEMADRHARERA